MSLLLIISLGTKNVTNDANESTRIGVFFVEGVPSNKIKFETHSKNVDYPLRTGSPHWRVKQTEQCPHTAKNAIKSTVVGWQQ